MDEKCPYCNLHPFEYVDIGIGAQPIAVNCCEYGHMLYQENMPKEQVDEMFAASGPHWWLTDDSSTDQTMPDVEKVPF